MYVCMYVRMYVCMYVCMYAMYYVRTYVAIYVYVQAKNSNYDILSTFNIKFESFIISTNLVLDVIPCSIAAILNGFSINNTSELPL